MRHLARQILEKIWRFLEICIWYISYYEVCTCIHLCSKNKTLSLPANFEFWKGKNWEKCLQYNHSKRCFTYLVIRTLSYCFKLLLFGVCHSAWNKCLPSAGHDVRQSSHRAGNLQFVSVTFSRKIPIERNSHSDEFFKQYNHKALELWIPLTFETSLWK